MTITGPGDSATITPPSSVAADPILSHPAQDVALERALARRTGLLLVAGRSGSGRSATLARMEQQLRAAGDSASAEAPLLIDGIHDRRSADHAVQSALLDRIVLATIDAAGALAAIQALREMRQDDFAIASTLRLVIGQQPVMRLCPVCRHPVQASNSVAALLGFDPGSVVHQAPGCPACDDSGVAGRLTIHEVIEVDYPLRRLINGGGDAAILARHAFVQMPTMGSVARQLARAGLISGAEAVRVSRGDPLVEPGRN
jgi:general secretion pathway protein E